MNFSGTGLVAAAALAFGLASTPAHAVNVFIDNFNYGNTWTVVGENGANQVNPGFLGPNWQVTGGTVDYLSAGGQFGNLCAGAPGCIDLDGTGGGSGFLETLQVFAPGSYVLAFAMAGSQRGTDETVTITLGDFEYSFTLGPDDLAYGGSPQFGTIFANIVTTVAGTLGFQNSGGDNVGVIIKSVALDQVSPVPLPAAGGLLMLALGGLGVMRRRKRG